MSEVETAFEGHRAFEYDADTGVATGTATNFEATVRASADGDGDDRAEFAVTVEVPTLSAATEEEVGDAVAEGWYETFELRMGDAYDVTRVADGSHRVEREGRDVRVGFEFTAPVRSGVDDAAALIDYVEGTYVQGTVPGYTYLPPVEGLLAAARRRGRSDEVDRSTGE